jgi:hypothetical protein
MKRRRWFRPAAVAVLTSAAVAAIVLGGMSPAVGFFSPPLTLDVHIQSPATLVARGAAVDVPLEIVCTSQQAEVFVQVTERVGSSIAQGFGDELVNCSGDLQDIVIRAFAQSNAFKRGTAVAQAVIFGCIRFCGEERDERQIQIVKK